MLTHDGMFVLQAGNADPLSHEFFASCTKTLEEIFQIVRPYWVPMFSFGLPWGFVIASKKEDPLELEQEDVRRRINPSVLWSFSSSRSLCPSSLLKGRFKEG